MGVERGGVSVLEYLDETVFEPHHVGSAFGGAFKLGFRVVEHACTETHAAVVALEYIIVDTTLALSLIHI